MASKIFEPWVMGPFTLANRVAMAPMTRNRADDDGIPSVHAVDYYRQRAGAGLIISEATQPSAAGRGYFGTPGIHSQEQQDAWAPIADAVHEASEDWRSPYRDDLVLRVGDAARDLGYAYLDELQETEQ